MGKPKVKRELKKFKLLATWKLVIILVLMLFVTATLLRLSNIGMSTRRDAVQAADKDGDKDRLQQRLIELKNYAFSHMNASTGTFYLEHQYRRDVQAALDEATRANSSNPNGNV
jgi:hypothetical protein